MPAPLPSGRTPGAPTVRGREDRHFVTALARGTEIAPRCALPKSTVSCLTTTLTRLGYLIHIEESGKHRLGTATLALGSAMLVCLDERQLARPAMQELADLAMAKVSLATRDRLSMINVENCRSSALLTLSLNVGSRIALATSAMGGVRLADLPADQRQPILDQLRARDVKAWPDALQGIDKALQDYRSLGVA